MDSTDSTSSTGGVGPSNGFFSLWVILIFIWIAANSSPATEPLAVGVVIAAVLAWFFGSGTDVWQSLKPSPARFYHFIRYTGRFLVEVTVSDGFTATKRTFIVRVV